MDPNFHGEEITPEFLHREDCPSCGLDIDRPELDWLWNLEPRMLLKLLEGSGSVAHAIAERTIPQCWAEMRSLAMQLVIEAPDGAPDCATEFLLRCEPARLYRLWNRGISPRGAQVAGVQIAAIDNEQTLPHLVAEISDLFRHWAENPAHARACAASAGITLPAREA